MSEKLLSLVRLALGLLVIVGFWAAGELIARIVTLPIPGSIVGMLLLTVSLQLGLVPLKVVEGIGALIVRYMALFFLPLGVGLIRYADVLAKEWLAIAAAVVGSTLAVLIVVGYTQQRLEPGD